MPAGLRNARPQDNFAYLADHQDGDHAQIPCASQKFGFIRVTA
jgi:hypothetical protein